MATKRKKMMNLKKMMKMMCSCLEMGVSFSLPFSFLIAEKIRQDKNVNFSFLLGLDSKL